MCRGVAPEPAILIDTKLQASAEDFLEYCEKKWVGARHVILGPAQGGQDYGRNSMLKIASSIAFSELITLTYRTKNLLKSSLTSFYNISISF